LNKPHLIIWTIYKNPLDDSGNYVAQKYNLNVTEEAVFIGSDLKILRKLIKKHEGLEMTVIPRHENDEIDIVESLIFTN
jgi:hypothetical protein